MLNTQFHLPLLEWINIPKGKVVISGFEVLFDVEYFAIAKYPTTNAQFRVFIEDVDGYHNQRWWQFSNEAQEWYINNPNPQPSVFDGDKFPRESVSWYEAIAFCQWLSEKTGLPVTLPTEVQWQRAAQGGDGRKYPFGKKANPEKFNTASSGIGRTTPIDEYPNGRSPFGVFDMSGNVWEWCLSKFDNPNDNDLSGEARRSVRGGSWNDSVGAAYTYFRTYSYPAYRLSSIGFRLALRLPQK